MPTMPKHPGARARRNKSSTAATLTRDHDFEPPPLPEHPDDREWHPKVVKQWDDLWDSPMASEYDDSDIHGMVVLMLLYDIFYTTTSATMRIKTASEIRLTGQRFGTSPLDRRRLEWQIEQTESAKDQGKRRRGEGQKPAAPPSGADDPRAILRSI